MNAGISEPQRQTLVASQIDSLNKAAERLKIIANKLQVRLQPIIRSDPLPVSTEKPSAPEQMPTLVSALNDIQKSVNKECEDLEETLRLLEI